MAYAKKNIQAASSINMTPTITGGHIRWKIFSTKIAAALRTAVSGPIGRSGNVVQFHYGTLKGDI